VPSRPWQGALQFRHAAKISRCADRSCGHTLCKCNIQILRPASQIISVIINATSSRRLDSAYCEKQLLVSKPSVRRFGWSCRLCRTTVRMFEHESQQGHRLQRSQEFRSGQVVHVVPTTRLSSTFPNRVSPREGKRWKERSPLGRLVFIES
jgi:hypothetical protein